MYIGCIAKMCRFHVEVHAKGWAGVRVQGSGLRGQPQKAILSDIAPRP